MVPAPAPRPLLICTRLLWTLATVSARALLSWLSSSRDALSIIRHVLLSLPELPVPDRRAECVPGLFHRWLPHPARPANLPYPRPCNRQVKRWCPPGTDQPV